VLEGLSAALLGGYTSLLVNYFGKLNGVDDPD
jgi:hypothetical protein